jgi:hypothetical protein
MVVNELHGHHIPNGAVRPLLIILSPPSFNHGLSFLQGHKLVLVQALISELAVETLDKRILNRLPRLMGQRCQEHFPMSILRLLLTDEWRSHLPLASLHAATGYSAGQLGEVAEHLPKHAG